MRLYLSKRILFLKIIHKMYDKIVTKKEGKKDYKSKSLFTLSLK